MKRLKQQASMPIVRINENIDCSLTIAETDLANESWRNVRLEPSDLKNN